VSTFLVYTSPATGHLFPLVPGLLALQERGHEVHVLTAPNLVETARNTGLRNVGALDPRVLEVDVRDYEARSGKERLVVGFENLLGRAPAEAEQLYRRLLAVNPMYAAAHLNLGFLLRQLGRESEAGAELATAAQLDPKLAQERAPTAAGP